MNISTTTTTEHVITLDQSDTDALRAELNDLWTAYKEYYNVSAPMNTRFSLVTRIMHELAGEGNDFLVHTHQQEEPIRVEAPEDVLARQPESRWYPQW